MFWKKVLIVSTKVNDSHLPRHYFLLEHPPREVGDLQPHEAEQQLLGLVAVILGPRGSLLLTPEDDELDDGVEERLDGRLLVVLLPDVPGSILCGCLYILCNLFCGKITRQWRVSLS